MCGSLAGWFQVAIQAVDWCSRASSIGLRCRFCEIHRRHLMHGGTQTTAFGGYNMSTGVKAHVAGSCGCKAGWFEMFPRLCKVDRDVRQPGRLVSGGYPGRRLVCSRASSIYWFKLSFLRGSPSAFDAWWHANNPLLGATTCPLV